MSGVALAAGGAVGVGLYLLGRRIEARRAAVLESELASLRERYRDHLRRWGTIDLSGLHPLNREEAERLIDRAESEGVHALTQKDRVFLDNMADGR